MIELVVSLPIKCSMDISHKSFVRFWIFDGDEDDVVFGDRLGMNDGDTEDNSETK